MWPFYVKAPDIEKVDKIQERLKIQMEIDDKYRAEINKLRNEIYRLEMEIESQKLFLRVAEERNRENEKADTIWKAIKYLKEQGGE
jgi:hypothetical protein